MRHLVKYSMIHLPEVFSIYKKDKNKENFFNSLSEHENKIGRGRMSVCPIKYKHKAINNLMHMKTLKMIKIYKILQNISNQEQIFEKPGGHKVTLHVKEIPESWTREELQEAFLFHGEISLFCFSSNDRSALVKYKSKQSCKMAIEFYNETPFSPYSLDWSEDTFDSR